MIDKNHFLIELSESEHTDFGKVDFDNQSTAQKVFSAIWDLESQVNNGGFEQFFRNIDGEIVGHAPEALRTIGAQAYAKIVERSIKVLKAKSVLPHDLNTLVDELDEEALGQLSELDSEFMAYPDNLTEFLFEYVRMNPKDFGPVPESQ